MFNVAHNLAIKKDINLINCPINKELLRKQKLMLPNIFIKIKN